jgi:hypothetical protein
MPDMNGFELAAILKKKNPVYRSTPIPAATAVSDHIAGSIVLRQAAMISLPNLSRLPRQEYRDL